MSRTETRPDAAPPPAPPAPAGPLGGPPGGGRGPGAPFRAFPALLLLGLLLAGAVLLWTWQRDRTQDAAVAGANRAAATAQAQQDAQATASVTARGAAATATVSAIQTAIPGVPEFRVERVEPSNTPLYAAIRAAEDRYWEVYAEAVFDLDTSRLPEIASGEELQRMISVVDELRARGRVLDSRLTHTSVIFNTEGKRAFVRDRATDRSVLLDAVTKERILTAGPDPSIGETEVHIYTYEYIEDKWKVTRGYMILNAQ